MQQPVRCSRRLCAGIATGTTAMNNRRNFCLALASAPSWSLDVGAQQPGRTFKLGWLSTGAPRTESYNLAFFERLRALGFAEGRNLVIEYRSADGRVDRLAELALELARQKCDIYVAPGSEASLMAMKQATRDEPIIIAANDYDPVATGHVASLARPGGRITGVYQLQEEIVAKRLELIRELLPKARKVGVLADSASLRQLVLVRDAARALGLELIVHEFKSAPYDFDAAFAAFARGKVDAVLPLASGLFVPARRKLPELALQHRLPGMFNNAQWAEAGGLVSYGVDFDAAYRRAAEMVAQVLNGAKPADLPVQQATVIEMVVNLRTAKALGVVLPQGIVLRANRVIE